MSYLPSYSPAPPAYGGYNSSTVPSSTVSLSSSLPSSSSSHSYGATSTLTGSSLSSSPFSSSSLVWSSGASLTSVTVASGSTITLSSSVSTSPLSGSSASTSVSIPTISTLSSSESGGIPTISTLSTLSSSVSSSAGYTAPITSSLGSLASSSLGSSSSSSLGSSSASLPDTSHTSSLSTETSAPYPCPSCFFGATSATLLSFPATILETVTAVTIPYKSICADGDTSTWTSVAYVPATPAPDALIFSDVKEMTWEMEGVEMHYPTTYAHFLGFARNTFIPSPTTIGTASPTACSGHTFATPISIPSTVVAPASLIAPITSTPATTTLGSNLFFSLPVPTNLVSYLESIGSETSIPGLTNLAGCAPLHTLLENTTPVPTTSCSLYTTYTTLGASTLHTTSTSTCPDGDVVTSTYTLGAAVSASAVVATGCETVEKRREADPTDGPALQGLIPGDAPVLGATWLEFSTARTRTVVSGEVVETGGVAVV